MTDTTTAETINSEVPAPDADAPDTPKKRGRGRPPASDSAKPEKETATGASGTPRARKTTGKTKLDSAVLGQQLMGLHELAFAFTGGQFPEIRIVDKEAEMLAASISGVCEQYNLSIDGKTGAFLQLMGTAAMIYGPRYFAVRSRIRAAQPIDVQSTVVQPGM